jgi:hypothetical protein
MLDWFTAMIRPMSQKGSKRTFHSIFNQYLLNFEAIAALKNILGLLEASSGALQLPPHRF